MSRPWIGPLVLALVLAPALSAQKGIPKVGFNRDVRPILSGKCSACHGPDAGKRRGKLRLDDREAAITRGAFVPGAASESALIERINEVDPRRVMPPPSTGKTLSASEKETLRRWVEEGAAYEPHWAYAPLSAPRVPEREVVPGSRTAIDTFIEERLRTEARKPLPEAPRRTLLRRVSLDLTGLPPEVADLEAFLADPDPRAYERQVERLLGSKRFGERMAQGWLDLVRYADSVGYHGDQEQHVFPYRDYVIDAFNTNKPFDVFTTEQLAGDLLPGATDEQLAATGFLRLNMMTREGGAQPGEYLAKYAADRVRTVATTWLGSTVGCAECHDHKFDPFTTRDFYRLSAFFADLREWGVYQDYPYTPNPDLKNWSNEHPFPPEFEVASPYLARRIEQLDRGIEGAVDEAARRRRADPAAQAAFAAWVDRLRAFLTSQPDGFAVPAPRLRLADGKPGPGPEIAAVRRDGRISVFGKADVDLVVELPLTEGDVATLRVEVLPDAAAAASSIRGGGRQTTISLRAALRRKGTEKPAPLGIWRADSSEKDPRYSDSSTVLGIKDGWLTSARTSSETMTGVWLLDRPFQAREGDVLEVRLGKHRAASFRIAVSPLSTGEPLDAGIAAAAKTALASEAFARGPASTALLDRLFLAGTAHDQGALARFHRLVLDREACRGGKAFVQIAVRQEPRLTRVLARGNWQDETGDVVTPGTPAFLPQLEAANDRLLDRRDLARWITSPENPLTARTFVNRLWKSFFGTGLSPVADDLGAQGEWPEHLALFDWLCQEFMKPLLRSPEERRPPAAWDVKHLVRLIVTSEAYRRSAIPARGEEDSAGLGNRLLTAQNPRRLDAEEIRDLALDAAGLLGDDLGGPSAHPYQPPGYYAALQFPDRDYHPDLDARQWRRGLYTHWQRTFLHPMLANFDAPSREECTAARVVSNTPQQALTLLNDPTFVEAARGIAARICEGRAGSDSERLARIFGLLLSRPPLPAEARSLGRYLEGERTRWRADPSAARKFLHSAVLPDPPEAAVPELAAWTSVARVVLNLHETITRY